MKAIAALALIALAGCAQQPIIRTRTVKVDVPVYVKLPAYLTQHTALESPQIATNADLADYALQCKADRATAYSKLDAIRKVQPR